jgi:uncharacterized protein (TIGR00255 family)
MSLRSMTGFGRGTATDQGLRCEVEVSSVSRRQLDVHVTVPAELRVLESRVQEEVAQALSRGRVLVDISVQGSARRRETSVRVDERLAATYVKTLRAAAKRLGLVDDLSAYLLLTLPGVLHNEPFEGGTEGVWPVVHKALSQGLARMRAMREREGASLQADLQERLNGLRQHLAEIRTVAPGVATRYREILLRRLAEANLPLSADDPRVLKEMAFFAERSDISEEITRLESHFQQAEQLFAGGGAVGKTLDFLAQEMHREINTIGSKANETEITRHVVAFKAELERWREQVQNIE